MANFQDNIFLESFLTANRSRVFPAVPGINNNDIYQPFPALP
jgi:hypothetical protein